MYGISPVPVGAGDTLSIERQFRPKTTAGTHRQCIWFRFRSNVLERVAKRSLWFLKSHE
jgi:hypothetical protein